MFVELTATDGDNMGRAFVKASEVIAVLECPMGARLMFRNHEKLEVTEEAGAVIEKLSRALSSQTKLNIPRG